MTIRFTSTIAIVALTLFGNLSLRAADEAKISAVVTNLTASDLASSLSIQSWSYTLRFDRPVSGVSVRLCELRRQANGTWGRTYLAIGHGFSHSKPAHHDVPVTVLIHNESSEYDFGLRIGGDFVRSKLKPRPVFSNTYSTPDAARFVDGCLALAIEEKNPQSSTHREENMVRVIGLEVESK